MANSVANRVWRCLCPGRVKDLLAVKMKEDGERWGWKIKLEVVESFKKLIIIFPYNLCTHK